jgi:hypothetical protein
VGRGETSGEKAKEHQEIPVHGMSSFGNNRDNQMKVLNFRET